MTAKERYDYLASDRSQFLNEAEDASKLTLPYLIRGHEENTKGMKQLKTPWQSVGAKGVVALASKLSLSLVPPQTSFFKLQLDESQLGQQFSPEIKYSYGIKNMLIKQENNYNYPIDRLTTRGLLISLTFE